MRYANVYGPRQDPKSEAGVVSIFVSRLLERQPLTVFGDGRQTRDYVFVKDVARANVLASSVSSLSRNEFAPARPGELFRSALDVSKAKAVLGWTPQYAFEDGLGELVHWFKEDAK